MINGGNSQSNEFCVARDFRICRNGLWLGCLFNYTVGTVCTFLLGFSPPSVAYSLESATVLLPLSFPPFFPRHCVGEQRVDPQHMLQMKEENWLICNKSRTGKLHCLLIPHRCTQSSGFNNRHCDSPCAASTFLLTLFTSVSCCERAVCPSGLELSPLPPMDLLCSQPRARGRLYTILRKRVAEWIGKLGMDGGKGGSSSFV